MKAFDHAMQFLLPVVLVRCLDAATFGEYRLLWLAVGTVMAFATLNMSRLAVLLPAALGRAARGGCTCTRRMLFLAAAGLVLRGSRSVRWNPLAAAGGARRSASTALLVPAFVALWVTAVLLDYLPTIDERIGWQA